MILTCPRCATRYQADAAKFPSAGRNVRCAKCGEVWHQVPPAEAPDPGIAFVAPPSPAARDEIDREPSGFVPPRAEAQRNDEAAARDQPVPPREGQPEPLGVSSFASPEVEPEPEDEGVVAAPPAPREIRKPRISSAYVPPQSAPVDDFEAEASEATAPRRGGGRRLALAAGWAGLALLVAMVGFVTFSFRRDIASLWPQSASLYKTVGLSVNASGLQFVGVTNKLETEGGAHVLVVSGKLINRNNRELSVPPIRIALTDFDRRELYHWPVISNVPTLKPGQAAPFLARLANPPGATHDVEVTFAKADE